MSDVPPDRSRVTTVTLTFAAPVNEAYLANPGGGVLRRTDGLMLTTTTFPSQVVLSAVQGLVTTLTLTFSDVGAGSLPDGRWRLNIAGINYQSPEFHRLFGDINGDGTVDGPNDFAEFGNVFGTVTDSPFDFDANGTCSFGRVQVAACAEI